MVFFPEVKYDIMQMLIRKDSNIIMQWRHRPIFGEGCLGVLPDIVKIPVNGYYDANMAHG